jgi:hypothetical protein
MKKSFFLTLFGLMLGIMSATGANVTNSTENLVFGKMWMEGSFRVGTAQRLHVEVTNNGTETYTDFWLAGAPSCYGNSNDITLAAGETKDVEVDILFKKEGHHNVVIMNSIEKELFTYTVDIAEYQAPRLKGEIRLDMLEQTDEGNFLYGNYANFRISGTATITNEGNYTYFGLGHVWVGGTYTGIVSCVWPWFGEYVTTYEPFYGLAEEIKPGETITKDFIYEFEAYPEEDQEYGIQIKAAVDAETETSSGITIASIPFKVRPCANTYWTANGHVKPLPVSADQVLKVPNEALAVDMRGQYEMNSTYSIDVSEANPNCLYYLGYLDNVPQGFSNSQNIIRNYEANTINIDADYDYFCPMSFKAKAAFFSYIPVSESWGPAQPYMSRNFSGTFMLPFEASKAWFPWSNESPGIDAGFNGNNLQVLKFMGDEDEFMIFVPVTENRLNAYEPYLIFTIPSQVDFYAENVMVPSTRPAVKKGTYFDFIGHTTQVSTKNDMAVYPWHVDYSHFYRSTNEELVRPFNAMMYAKTLDTDIYDILEISFNGDSGGGGEGASGGGDSTKIDAVSASSANHSKAVYSLNGQWVETLRPGIYIIDGKKKIVK